MVNCWQTPELDENGYMQAGYVYSRKHLCKNNNFVGTAKAKPLMTYQRHFIGDYKMIIYLHGMYHENQHHQI